VNSLKLFGNFNAPKLPYPSVNQLIKDGDVEALTDLLQGHSPVELADLIAQKSKRDQTVIFRALPQSLALQTFELLATQTQRDLLQSMPTLQATTLLKGLSPDDRIEFLQTLPREVVDELVKLLPYEERMLTLTLLGYPKGSIGRLMTPDYLAVGMDWEIENVLDFIQNFGRGCETLDKIYVVNEEGTLLGDIKLKDLFFVSRKAKVREVIDSKFIALSVNASDETAIADFKRSNLTVLPVIDEKGILLGVVTVDDILRLASKEATEDIQKIGGTEALDQPYLQAPFLELMNKRVRWLVILFFGEMLSATALWYFQDAIAKAVFLTLFLPLIISSGGNAGSQASTLVVRAMSLGEVHLRDWLKILKREMLSGIFLGVVLGFIGFFRVTIWNLFSNIYGVHWLKIATTISLSLVGVVLWGTLSGALLPLILKRIGIDPATSSGPFVATIVDVIGVIIYFLIAVHILKGTVL
jgi:magnesium transporter